MTATLQLSRTWGGLTDRSGDWEVVVDGAEAVPLAKRETVEIPVEPGRHTVRVQSSARFLSRERSFEVSDEDVVSFRCHSQRYWPMMIASLIKPNLWISLRQE